MTIEVLIKIIIEAVEKVMQLNNKKIIALVFDDANKAIVTQHMSCINDHGIIYSQNQLPELEKIDSHIVFLDYIPLQYIPKIALGITDDNFSKFMAYSLINGKKIFVLNKKNYTTQKTAIAYKKLLDNYYSMLQAFGIVFLDDNNKNDLTVNKSNFFTGKILTRDSLLETAVNSKIIIEPSTIITDLAKETAKKMNIQIIIS